MDNLIPAIAYAIGWIGGYLTFGVAQSNYAKISFASITLVALIILRLLTWK